MSSELTEYIPIFIMVIVAAGFAITNLILSYLVGPGKTAEGKLSPYECGSPPIGSARLRFPIKFYLIAMLFIIFDIEAVFLYPWAVVLREIKMLGSFVFYEMVLFILVLGLGLAYVWRRGALNWD